MKLPWKGPELRDHLFLGDSEVWMELAATLHSRGFPLRTAEQMHALNVANVCAGYAFELVFKALSQIATAKQPAGKHQPRVAFGAILREAPSRAAEIDRVIVEAGWSRCELLEHLDLLCNIDRKYWMIPRNATDPTLACFEAWHGKKGLEVLGRLHADLASLARSWSSQGHSTK